jgi:hypothetical protein
VAISAEGITEIDDDKLREAFDQLIQDRTERPRETHPVDVTRVGSDE